MSDEFPADWTHPSSLDSMAEISKGKYTRATHFEGAILLTPRMVLSMTPLLPRQGGHCQVLGGVRSAKFACRHRRLPGQLPEAVSFASCCAD